MKDKKYWKRAAKVCLKRMLGFIGRGDYGSASIWAGKHAECMEIRKTFQGRLL